MKKYVKIALLVIVALIFIGTFVFLYQKSQPKASVYTILNAEIPAVLKYGSFIILPQKLQHRFCHIFHYLLAYHLQD